MSSRVSMRDDSYQGHNRASATQVAGAHRTAGLDPNVGEEDSEDGFEGGCVCSEVVFIFFKIVCALRAATL